MVVNVVADVTPQDTNKNLIFKVKTQNLILLVRELSFIPQGGNGTFLWGVQVSFSFNLLYMNIYTPEIRSFKRKPHFFFFFLDGFSETLTVYLRFHDFLGLRN